MKNRASSASSIGLLIALVATVAAAPSYGQVYKWVDSNGRVNYSGQPPEDSTKTVKLVESNVSVYTPDDSLKRAVEENRQRKNYSAAPDNVYAVAAKPTCADMGMLPSPQGGCQPADYASNEYYPAYPYAPAVVYGRFRPRPVPLRQAQIPPGTIAGNVVGLSGYTAGNSTIPPAVPPARPMSLAGRGFPQR